MSPLDLKCDEREEGRGPDDPSENHPPAVPVTTHVAHLSSSRRLPRHNRARQSRLVFRTSRSASCLLYPISPKRWRTPGPSTGARTIPRKWHRPFSLTASAVMRTWCGFMAFSLPSPRSARTLGGHESGRQDRVERVAEGDRRRLQAIPRRCAYLGLESKFRSMCGRSWKDWIKL